jgi:hypothetical protein
VGEQRDVQGEVRSGSGAVRTRAELRHISRSGGMIIETFAVECSVVSWVKESPGSMRRV